jgi:endonuclease YncB( thermonuclease family)
MGLRRDLAGMSTAQWGLLCRCAFVVAMGAGLGLLTPAPHKQPEIVSAFRSPLQTRSQARTEIEVIRPGGTSPSMRNPANHAPFPICGRTGTDCVVDGDTFRYRGDTIRIADMDAPETRDAKCPSKRALGERAKHRLAELLGVAPFTLTSYDSRDRDRYARALGWCTRTDNPWEGCWSPRALRGAGKALGGHGADLVHPAQSEPESRPDIALESPCLAVEKSVD